MTDFAEAGSAARPHRPEVQDAHLSLAMAQHRLAKQYAEWEREDRASGRHAMADKNAAEVARLQREAARNTRLARSNQSPLNQ